MNKLIFSIRKYKIKFKSLSISSKIGFLTSILLTTVLVAYTIGLEFLLFNKPNQWSNVLDYAQQIHEKWQYLLTFCHIMVFISAPLYLVIVNCIDVKTRDENKILSRIGLSFATIFSVLGSINYFIQFTSVRQSILNGQLAGLEQFIQLNPYSATYAIVNLGWTLFLSLSSIFISFVFTGSRLNKMIKIIFLFNGIFCMIGFIGYLINDLMMNIIYLIGMGLSLIVVSVALIVFFRRNLTTASTL